MSTRRHHAQRWGAIALPVALGLASCTGDSGDAARSAAPPSRGRQLAISDQLHNNGTTGFVFLPPMVPRPAYFGDFLPDLEPVVRIDELGPTGATVRTLATFTRDSGPGRERIRVHRQGEPCDRDDDDGDSDPNGYFYARWFTNHERLSTAAVYRVRVFVQERVHPCTRNGWGRRCRHGEDNTAPMREIGYADVDVVRNAPEVRAVDRTEFVPLINGRTLRIKFRIDRPVVDADGDGVYNWRDNCRTTANASQLDTDRDGEGDACECAGVTCAPTDACHAAGACSPTNGMCSNPAAPDGSACPLTNAAGLCAAGVCGAPTCSAGFGNCDGNAANGCEQQTNTTAHCGGCNVACTSGAHSTATCATGTCGLVCAAGWFDADGDRANGCELDITTDANCGAPGNACVSGTGGTTTCVSGACSTMACPSGLANCNTAIGDGCEVTLGTDVGNCGACGRACAVPNATAACSAGHCAVGACASGFADVNGDPADGCEVNLATDPSHCGAAGNVCPAPANGTAACLSGTCGIGSCASGFADVNGDVTDGCEVSFATSPSHCGGLHNACSAPNGTAGCAMGQCTLAACDAGFASCDGSATNGCETATSSDVSNCGACGAACPSGANSAPTCAVGACGIACAAGFADVNGSPTDGCEVNLATDPSHCGRVGVVCTQGRTCQSGACTSTTCVSGLANCDGQEATGCEVTLATDPSHCGACGRACAFPNARPDCVAGACTFTVCDLGFADVDGNRANGCEVNLATDVNHCGAPGTACAAPSGGSATCTNGLCGQTCPTGTTHCGGACRNTQTDSSACGSACVVCSGGATCVSGVCVAAVSVRGYLYVPRTNGDVYRCPVQSDGTLGACVASGAPLINLPYGVTVNGAWAYITGFNDSTLTKCAIGAAGALSGCVASGATGLVNPTQMAVAGSTAYVANYGNASVTVCTISSSDGSLSGCSTQYVTGAPVHPHGIAANGGQIYMSRYFQGRIDRCSGGACSTAAIASGPIGVYFSGSRGYYSSLASNFVSSCALDAAGNLVNCASVYAGFNQPMGFAAAGTKMYVTTHGGGAVFSCAINADGTLSGCTSVRSLGASLGYPAVYLLP